MECKRLTLENESYQKFLNTEHNCLFIQNKSAKKKALDLV